MTADLAEVVYLDWTEMTFEVPRFMRTQLEGLRRARRGLKAVFVDSGDTLIDETSQTFHPQQKDLVLSADPIKGVEQLMNEIVIRGYPVALVADGREQSFRNVLGPIGLWDMFNAKAISEKAGCSKPDPRIFNEAMRRIGLRPEDASGVVMMGNNIGRDIRGANRLGIVSVWIDWNERYDRTIASPDDQPTYRVERPEELLSILDGMVVKSGFEFE